MKRNRNQFVRKHEFGYFLRIFLLHKEVSETRNIQVLFNTRETF